MDIHKTKMINSLRENTFANEDLTNKYINIHKLKALNAMLNKDEYYNIQHY